MQITPDYQDIRWAALEKELADVNRQFRTLFDSMVVGVLQTAPDRQIIRANLAAERILRLPRSEIVGRPYDAQKRQLIRELDLKPMRRDEFATTKAFERHETVANHHCGIQNEDGSTTWLAISAAPILDRDGGFHGVVTTFADITKHKRTELELKESKDQYHKTLDLITRALEESELFGNQAGEEERQRLETLTHREREVLRLVAQGQTNEEIGSILKISGTTVRRHVTNINGKLVVRNRVEAVLIALRTRLTNL